VRAIILNIFQVKMRPARFEIKERMQAFAAVTLSQPDVSSLRQRSESLGCEDEVTPDSRAALQGPGYCASYVPAAAGISPDGPASSQQLANEVSLLLKS
jgi:hypothetical protein